MIFSYLFPTDKFERDRLTEFDGLIHHVTVRVSPESDIEELIEFIEQIEQQNLSFYVRPLLGRRAPDFDSKPVWTKKDKNRAAGFVPRIWRGEFQDNAAEWFKDVAEACKSELWEGWYLPGAHESSEFGHLPSVFVEKRNWERKCARGFSQLITAMRWAANVPLFCSMGRWQSFSERIIQLCDGVGLNTIHDAMNLDVDRMRISPNRYLLELDDPTVTVANQMRGGVRNSGDTMKCLQAAQILRSDIVELYRGQLNEINSSGNAELDRLFRELRDAQDLGMEYM